MNPNKFSFSRFASFFRWYAAIGTKTTIKIATITALGSMVLALVMYWNQIPKDNGIYQAIFFVASCIVWSMILSDVEKNTIRQQFLAIPATNLEKYLSVITLVIIRTICIIIALYLVDVIRATIQYTQINGFKLIINTSSNNIVNYLSFYILFCSLGLVYGLLARKYVVICFMVLILLVRIKDFISLFNSSIEHTPFDTQFSIIASIISSVAFIIMGFFFMFRKIELNTGWDSQVRRNNAILPE